MTFSDQVMALTLGQILKMTFKGQIIVHLTHLDKVQDAGKINVVLLLSQKVVNKTFFLQKR